MKTYDVVVLGAGPGGYVSAIRAAQLGAKVAIVEKKCIGGTCLNVGCIPTKALIKNVEILHGLEIGRKRGIKVDGEIILDYKRAVKAKDKAVKQLVGGVEGLLGSHGIDIYKGNGIAQSDNTITIESEESYETISYDKLIIATGSSPAIPPIKGADLDNVVTNEELLSEENVPEHLVIIGGGVIGCEFASIFNAYGSKVTIIEMLPSLVAVLDDSISDYMNSMMEDAGVELLLSQGVKEISKNNEGTLIVQMANQEGNVQTISGDKVLISVGRKPNTSGLEQLNLDIGKGFIQVNDELETNKKGVYAIGDVTGKKTLAHVASEMGVVAAENAMGHAKKMDLSVVPSCIYTIPEVGSVGLSEKEAKEKGFEISIGTFPLMACGKAVATGEPEGLFKIIADKNTRKLLGAHLIGKSATEVVAETAAYLKMGATIDDIIDTIHAHPTISESVAEAARDIDGWAIHMPKK